MSVKPGLLSAEASVGQRRREAAAASTRTPQKRPHLSPDARTQQSGGPGRPQVSAPGRHAGKVEDRCTHQRHHRRCQAHRTHGQVAVPAPGDGRDDAGDDTDADVDGYVGDPSACYVVPLPARGAFGRSDRLRMASKGNHRRTGTAAHGAAAAVGTSLGTPVGEPSWLPSPSKAQSGTARGPSRVADRRDYLAPGGYVANRASAGARLRRLEGLGN